MRTYSVPVSIVVAAAIGAALWVALEVVPWSASKNVTSKAVPGSPAAPARRLWTLVASLLATTAISLIVVTRDPKSLGHAVSLGVLALLIPVAVTTAYALRVNNLARTLRRSVVFVVAGVLVSALTYLLGR